MDHKLQHIISKVVTSVIKVFKRIERKKLQTGSLEHSRRLKDNSTTLTRIFKIYEHPGSTFIEKPTFSPYQHITDSVMDHASSHSHSTHIIDWNKHPIL
jgi:hypothetical protein